MNDSLRKTILDIAGTAVSAVEPHQAVTRRVSLDGSRLFAGGGEYDLDAFERVVVVGAGKASAPMAVAVEEVLGDRIASGVVVVKEGHAEKTRKIEIIEAGHPEPDRRGEAGARKLLDLVRGAGRDALIIALMSGGRIGAAAALSRRRRSGTTCKTLRACCCAAAPPSAR